MSRLYTKCALGDISKISTGKLDANAEVENGKYPFFTCGEEILQIDEYAFDTEAILLAGNGNFGTKYYKGKFNAYQRTYVIEPMGVNGKWLFYCVCHLISKITGGARGSTIKYLRLGDISGCPISLPPLNEQKRIVAKIEAMFSELDKGVENLKAAQAQLKTYRQSILKFAFSHFDLSATVGELFDFVGGGTPSKKEPTYWNGDIPWASVKDVKGDYLIKTMDTITEKAVVNSATNLADVNDVILITRISPGKTIISVARVAINQDLKIVKPKGNAIPLFIHYLFKSLEKEILKLSSGTTVLGINLNNLKSIKAPNLTQPQQQKLVESLEEKFSVVDDLESCISFELQKSNSLRQSILKKAFAGELVAQDPNDEPATKLLERIKEEQKTAGEGKKKRARAS